MKKLKLFLTLIVVATTVSTIYAQGRFGKDSADCTKYLSYYGEYMKQGNMNEAAPLWRKAIKLCPPTASQNMLLDGMKILRRDINRFRNNPIRKEELVDSLMMLHSMRIDTYPRYVIPAKTNRAMDMINYSGKGKEKDVYDAITDLMVIAKGKTNSICLVKYMDYAKNMYEAGMMTPEDVMETFSRTMEVVTLVEAVGKDKNIANVKRDIENLFMVSGVANCDNLVELFTPRFEANPTDKEVVSNIVSLLSSTNCMETELFLNAVESLHKIEPSHNTAYLLFKLFANTGDFSAAAQYMDEAIVVPESDDAKDAEYFFELATFFYKKTGEAGKAVTAAKNAAVKDPTLAGKAYMLIGTIWGSQKCEGNDIEKRAPYWVAVDYMRKAKNADETLADEANKMIAQYSKYFPQQSEAFMFDVLDGASYTVSCGGMRETTIVRTQK